MKKFKEIDELNRKSKLRFKLGEGNSNVLKNVKFEVIHNFMSLDFFIPNKHDRELIIRFYSFPTDEDKRVLADYVSKNPIDSVFGISVGMDIKTAEEKLFAAKYEKVDDGYLKGKVKLSFRVDNAGKITQMEISLLSEYKGNRLY